MFRPTILALICMIAFTHAVNVTRSRRQYSVPLHGACNDYVACAPPATCMSGRCACSGGYQPSGPSCVQGPYIVEHTQYDPRVPVGPAPNGQYYTNGQINGVVASDQPQYKGMPPASKTTYRTVYTENGYRQVPVAAAVPAPPPQPTYAAVPMAAPRPVAVAAPQPYYYVRPAVPVKVAAPVMQMPVMAQAPAPQRVHIHDTTYIRVPVPVPVDRVAATTGADFDTTTSSTRMFDSPSIAYPGESCESDSIHCVGGSMCIQGVCVCRRGEDIVNRQCMRVEVTSIIPTVTYSEPETTTTEEYTTTTTTTTATTTTTTTTETSATATASSTDAITPMTTTTRNLPTDATSTTFTSTGVLPTNQQSTTSTSTTEWTTTPVQYSEVTSTMVDSQFAEEPQNCNQPSCCPTGYSYTNNGCSYDSQQIFRINVVVSPGNSCMNSAQCARGAYCGQGICRCTSRYAQVGNQCLRRH